MSYLRSIGASGYHEAKKRLSNRAGYQPNWQTDLNQETRKKAKGKDKTKNGGNNNKDNKEGGGQ